jgi:hypothetical protein
MFGMLRRSWVSGCFPPVESHGDDVSAFEFTLMRGASVFVFLGVDQQGKKFLADSIRHTEEGYGPETRRRVYVGAVKLATQNKEPSRRS